MLGAGWVVTTLCTFHMFNNGLKGFNGGFMGFYSGSTIRWLGNSIRSSERLPIESGISREYEYPSSF